MSDVEKLELAAAGAVTVQGAVKEFGIGRTKLYELMTAGALPWSQLGGNGSRRLIPRAALRKLLASGTKGNPPAGV